LRVLLPGEGRRRADGSRLALATVQASGLAKHFGDRELLRDVSFKLERRDRMALAGRNGSGKTTLLRILAGEISPDEGRVSFERGARAALHDQRPPRAGGATLAQYVISGLDWVLEIERELERLEARMASDASEATLAAYATAQGRLEHAGGYRWRDQAQATVRGLGFGDAELRRELATFSGGELTRASLARALASQPDVLLLDEPTNHLDIESLEWLEGYLAEVDAAVVLVAHDRWFLESVGTSVLELDRGRARFFAGRWHAWRAEKAARELALGRDVARRQAEIARMERFVERFRAKATKARQAQSKLKQIDRLRAQGVEGPPAAERTLSFSFGDVERSGKIALELEGGRLVAGDRTLLEDGTLWIERGEHVCLIGPNGSGKTTLVEALVGRRELDGGKLQIGHNVEVGYLSQHAELPRDDQLTALAFAQSRTGLSEAKTRALLGRFLFTGDDAVKAVTALSGGEAQRLGLAILVSTSANLLILDEPTNHLDVESREALEDALSRYAGSLFLISHDRALLEAVGTRTFAFEDGRLRAYPGGWAEYRTVHQADREEPPAPTKEPDPTRGREARRRRAAERRATADAKRLEREIEAAEAALRELEEELADPALWADGRTAAKSSRRHEAARARVEDLYARWEAADGGKS
jgi:ATP-binding cassette, subfamily F, member 3